MSTKEARQRATATYRQTEKYRATRRATLARKRAAKTSDRTARKPSQRQQAWKEGSFPQASAPPSRGSVYCHRCEEFGHGIDEHLSPYANDHFIPTCGGYTRKAGAE